MNQRIKLAVGIACISVFSAFFIFAVFSPGFSQWERKGIAQFFITEGWRKLSATNTVTTIVWEYRGYDTLGEETVLFTAAMGVFAMGFGLFSAEKIQGRRESKTEAAEKSVHNMVR
jgi:multisubunit Na+/H+ antiporter MnhB subunit